ncbi:hypothetical protein GCM10010228_04890 [Streptomyces massasporeus]|nr:hypothetical protein GCM10010228_04890 [Streptomyces massasporeus]
MRETGGQHRPVLHRDHGHEQEREQTQDLPQAADRDATGESSRAEFGELYRCHVRRGCPGRANCGLRERGLGIARGKRLGGERHRGLCAEGRGRGGIGLIVRDVGEMCELLDLKIA